MLPYAHFSRQSPHTRPRIDVNCRVNGPADPRWIAGFSKNYYLHSDCWQYFFESPRGNRVVVYLGCTSWWIDFHNLYWSKKQFAVRLFRRIFGMCVLIVTSNGDYFKLHWSRGCYDRRLRRSHTQRKIGRVRCAVDRFIFAAPEYHDDSKLHRRYVRVSLSTSNQRGVAGVAEERMGRTSP